MSNTLIFNRGTLSGGSIAEKQYGQAWGLSQLGNWSTFTTDANGDGDLLDAGDLDHVSGDIILFNAY